MGLFWLYLKKMYKCSKWNTGSFFINNSITFFSLRNNYSILFIPSGINIVIFFSVGTNAMVEILFHHILYIQHSLIVCCSNMTSFFCFVAKRAIYRLGIITLAHVPVHVTDFPVVNVHVDELSSARIWQHKLCPKFAANVNINYCLPIKVYYHICTLRHIRIKINHGSQNLFWVLTWVGGY